MTRPAETCVRTPGAAQESLSDTGNGVANPKVDHAVYLLKGLAIIGVVGRHLANKHFPATERATLEAIGTLFIWVSPLFIVLSGYLHGLAHQRRETKVIDLALHRGRRLLVPFVIVTFGFTLIYTQLVRMGLIADPGDPVSSFWERWQSTLLSRSHRVGEQLYFLPLIYAVSVISSCFVRGFKGSFIWLLGFALLLFAGSLAFPSLWERLPFHPPLWGWAKFATGVSVYVLGFLIATHRDRRLPFFVAASLASAVALLTQFAPLLQFSFPIVLTAGLTLVPLRTAFLETLGKASGTIFLYHTPFLIQPMLVGIATFAPSHHAAWAWLALAVTLALLCGLHALLSRSRLKWLTY